MRTDLPRGTVTFLFTDVEGSTRLLHDLGAEDYAGALAEHRRVIRESCARYHGIEVDTQGDAFFFAFPTAPGALAAAAEMTEAFASGPIQVRMGLHTGTPLLTDEGYVGGDVHFAARIAGSGHGGQVVVSSSTAALMDPSNRLLQGASLLDLGEHRLKDIAEPVPIFQLGDSSFPPLKTISNTNLPRPASSFVGREQELHQVLARIEGGARLVTLTGSRFARALADAGGADVDAARLLSCAEAMLEEIGTPGPPYLRTIHEEAFGAISTRLDQAALAEAWVAGRKLTADEAVALALASLD